MKRTAVDASVSSINSSAAQRGKPARKRARTGAEQDEAVSGTSIIIPPSTGLSAPSSSSKHVQAPIDQPKKRARIAGSLKRLAVAPPPRSDPSSTRTLPHSTLSGSLVSTPSKDPSFTTEGDDNALVNTEIVLVKRNNGRGMGGYLKLCLRAILERGRRRVEIHAMSAAIDVGIRVALATRDALPGGKASVRMVSKTRTVDVRDVVIPDDDRLEPVDQTRSKSALKIVLEVREGVKFATTTGKRGAKSSDRKRGGKGARRKQ